MASKRAAILVLVSAPLLAHCMPDFDALSAGLDSSAGTSSGGDGNAGDGPSGSGSSTGGASSKAGSPSGGAPSGGTTAGSSPISGAAGAGGEATQGGAGGDAGNGGAGLGGAAGGEGGGSGEGGSSGVGGGSSCESPATGVTPHNTFDEGLNGPGGFLGVSSSANLHTALGATGSSGWDADAGSSCPGALRFTFKFKGYASGSAQDEKGYADYIFTAMDWSDWAALHVMVKVSPAAVPVASLQLFVLSGSEYLFWGEFDDGGFKSGDWREMILRPVAGPYYDPSSVFRIGVELVLARADTQGIPATVPTIDVWFDDMWLEAK